MANLKDLSLISDKLGSLSEIKIAANLIAKTKVEPSLSELRRRIELEKGKLWRKVFGRTISWLPLIAKSIISPSPDVIYSALSKGRGDLEQLLSTAQGISSVQQQGLNFLLKLQDVTTNQ